MEKLFIGLLLSLTFTACVDQKSGGDDSKSTQEPITTSSSQFAQEIAGKKWCSISAFFDEELNVDMYDRYDLNTDGSATFSVRRYDNDQSVSSDKASWSASEDTITFSIKGEKVTTDAYLDNYYLVITRDMNGIEQDDYFKECN